MAYGDGGISDLQMQAAGKVTKTKGQGKKDGNKGSQNKGGKVEDLPPGYKYENGIYFIDTGNGWMPTKNPNEYEGQTGSKGGLGKKVDGWIKDMNEGRITPEQIQNLVNDAKANMGKLSPSDTGKLRNYNRFLDAAAGMDNPNAGEGGGGYVPDENVTTGPQTVEEYLDGGLNPNAHTKGMGQNAIMAAALEDAMQGRKFAYEEFAGAEEDFLNDPLVSQLNQSATDLLENPDIISDELQQQMLSGSDAILSRAYSGQQSNLAGQIGGLNMDPNDPLAQSLAAQGRFGALQQQSTNKIGIQTQAAQLNRQGLENAMRLGMGTAAFTQGTLNQFTANRANLLAGQPLAQIGPEAAALQAAMNFDSSTDGGVDWASLGVAGLSTVASMYAPGSGTVINNLYGETQKP